MMKQIKQIKQILAWSLAAALLTVQAGCGPSAPVRTETEESAGTEARAEAGDNTEKAGTEARAEEESNTEKAGAEGDIDQQVRDILAGMTTEQKLAQMMVVALRSAEPGAEAVTEINEDYAGIIQKYDFGGILLFGPNIVDTKQVVTMIHDSQEAAMASEQGTPLLVCVDQEGGIVNRVSFGTTSSGNMALAATGQTALTEESAQILGEEIKALGFQMDFAPVSDVNNNPANPVIGVRAFSDDPELAAEHVRAYIRGLQKVGMSSSLKHFPGHGNVGEDSHSHLPCSYLSLEELEACELVPFAAGIDEGADMIMTAHIQYPEIEKNTYRSVQDGREVFLPATLSRTIITGLLREQMGYDGIVVTDALDMNAITSHFDPCDAGTMAINAGIDILLLPVNLYRGGDIDSFPEMDSYMENLLARVESGEIPEEELDDSVYRILRLKAEKGLTADMEMPSPEEQIAEAEAVVGSAEHHAREWEIVREGITLLKNDDGLLPIAKGSNTLILYTDERRRPTVDYTVSRLQKEGLLRADSVTVMGTGELPEEEEALQNILEEADQAIILSQAVVRDENILRVMEGMHRENRKVVLLSIQLPYDAACYEEADAVLCAYNHSGSAHDAEGNGPFNLNVTAALGMAFGEDVPKGRLPVNIPRIFAEGNSITFTDDIMYERGYGMTNFK